MVSDKTATSANDALIPSQIKLLIGRTDNEVDKFILTVLGNCGLRAGELLHMKKGWCHVGDEEAEIFGHDFIEIPKRGLICDCEECRIQKFYQIQLKRYKEKYEVKNANTEWFRKTQKKYYRLKASGKLPKLQRRWKPKSKKGAGKIPINKETGKVISEFFEKYDSLNITRRQLHKRVSRHGLKVLPDKHVYPHSLRASVATNFANSGKFTSTDLRCFMRWSNIAVADSYVKPDERRMIEAYKTFDE
jgi:integrase